MSNPSSRWGQSNSRTRRPPCCPAVVVPLVAEYSTVKRSRAWPALGGEVRRRPSFTDATLPDLPVEIEIGRRGVGDRPILGDFHSAAFGCA